MKLKTIYIIGVIVLGAVLLLLWLQQTILIKPEIIRMRKIPAKIIGDGVHILFGDK